MKKIPVKASKKMLTRCRPVYALRSKELRDIVREAFAGFLGILMADGDGTDSYHQHKH